jgi:hypothetical protein
MPYLRTPEVAKADTTVVQADANELQISELAALQIGN